MTHRIGQRELRKEAGGVGLTPNNQVRPKMQLSLSSLRLDCEETGEHAGDPEVGRGHTLNKRPSLRQFNAARASLLLYLQLRACTLTHTCGCVAGHV